jgi:hypothetical protein
LPEALINDCRVGSQPLSRSDAVQFCTALVLSSNCREDEMSKMEINDDVESGEFTDALSDEALDREEAGKACCSMGNFVVPVADR